ncbi:hypothetical protein AB0G54_41435 [Streptomyces yokosukanensis]|uniref:hypothetical protein n=1 Tax=Streptomyces yokosukanensis TaxID=67386 RepID=UPI00131E433C|nr:hypothetical protein [Streptomyces yokosukanensis]
MRAWVDGGIDLGDAAQRQALGDLAAADMVTRGDIISWAQSFGSDLRQRNALYACQ